MRILPILFLITGLFMFSCGGDSVSSQKDNKCKEKSCTKNSTCQEETGECKCDTGFIKDGDKCISESEDKCKDKTCQDHATCEKTTGECKCNTGFIADGYTCIAEDEDKCKDVTCQDHATCEKTTGECKCDAGFMPDGSNCIVDPCANINCSTNEVCNAGECECKDGYFYSSEVKLCIEDKDCNNITCDHGYSCSGGTCYLDNECSANNPSGACPVITGEPILLCKNGLCITENDGALQEGESCNPATNECVSGTICIDSFNNHLFKCRAFCDMNVNDSCGTDGVCAPYLNDYAQNTGICIKSDSECANGEDNCPEHFKCEMMINARVCKAQGNQTLGNECDNNFETNELDACEEGLFCVGDEGSMNCQELCDPDLQNDTCNQGRCLALKDIDGAVHNTDIGLCMDLPYFCNTTEGIKDNPSCNEGTDPICVGDGSGAGMCFVDMCDTADANSCEGIDKCTRSITSKLMCIPAGTIGYGQTGCVNPQDDNTPEADIIPSKLCQQGLNCFEGKCMELCDPTSTNSCVNDSNATCMDIHTFKADYPAGINGACVSFGVK